MDKLEDMGMITSAKVKHRGGFAKSSVSIAEKGEKLPKECTLLWDLKVEECEHEELKELEKFHYRGSNPGIVRKSFKAMIGNDLAAGIIFVFPHFALKGRNIAFPEFKGKTTTKQVKMIN